MPQVSDNGEKGLNPERWEQIKQLLHSALEQEPSRRAEFLRDACGGDESLRAEIESMLARHAEFPTFLESRVSPETVGETLSVYPDGEQPGQGQMKQGDSLPAGTRLGPYEILAPIGAGGMGKVYKARDTRLGRLVAIKISKEEFSERFEREARAVAALNHPHICTLHDVGPNYLVMEYIEGTPLAGPLPVEKAIEYAAQILDALETAHGNGVIHRDLKPSNILVTKKGIKLLDFGLAKLQRPGAQGPASDEETDTVALTQPGVVMGTPAYMAPEQWEGRPADARSDIYAFGCVFYEMLTGKRFAQERVPLRPAPIENVLRRCLAKNPEERWQSAGELRKRLALVSVQRKRRRFTIAAAASLAATLAAVLFWPHTHAAPLTDKDVIVLADFTNNTADPIFDVTLREYLAGQLEESPFLKIMGDEQVREDLRLMKRPPGDRITNQIAREVCLREGHKATIAGSIAGLGKSYAISLQATNCRTGEILARQQGEAEDKEHVLRTVAASAAGLRAKLGESLHTVQKTDRLRNLAQYQATTASLEAYQAFALGLDQISRGSGHAAAIPFAQRATELDPNFATAWELLGNAYIYGFQTPREKQIECFKKAFSLVDRVSEWERLRISAFYYRTVTGEFEKAADISKLLIQTYPRQPAPHNTLGLYYLNLTGELEKALHEFQEAQRLEPSFPSYYLNIMAAHFLMGQVNEAKAVAEKLYKISPQVLEDPRYHAGWLVTMAQIAGDRAEEEKEIQWFIGRSLEYQAWSIQAWNAWRTGRLRQANILTKRAVDLARRRNALQSAEDLLRTEARRNGLMGNCPAALSYLRQVRISSPPLLNETADIAETFAFCGDASRAQKLADELSRHYPKSTLWHTRGLPRIRAAMALSRNRPAEVIELLRFIVPENTTNREDVYLRGLAYLLLRKGAEAAADFQSLLDHNLPRSDNYHLAKVGLARGLTMAGDNAKAKKTYKDFLALWKDADSDVPLLKEARKEYAALR